jgi:predicted RNA binding protein with dsRBD fold (UPF0201 family)
MGFLSNKQVRFVGVLNIVCSTNSRAAYGGVKVTIAALFGATAL